MNFHMLSKMTFLQEGLITMSTNVVPDSTMCFRVQLQFLLGCKCSTTIATREWFLIGVHTVMMDKISFIHKFFAAQMTQPFGF